MKKWLIFALSLTLLFSASLAEDTLSPEQMTGAAGAEQGRAGGLGPIEPEGDDPMLQAMAEAYNAFLAGPLAAADLEGDPAILPASAPQATLMGSFALRTSDAQYAEAPGQSGGIQRAASLLFGRMAAYAQTAAAAGQPYQAGFMPQQFTTSLLQSAAADGKTAADSVMLSLTDASGKKMEGGAYVFTRFFGADGSTVLWLSSDLRTLQILAQVNQIRTSGGTGLSLSATAAPKAAETPLPAQETAAAVQAVPAPQEFASAQAAPADEPAAPAPQAYSGEPTPFVLPTPAPTPEPQMVKITSAKGANVRAAPSDNGSWVGVAKPNHSYQYLGVAESSYIYIMLDDGRSGYINPKFVGPLPGEEDGPRVVATKTITIHERATYNSYEPGTASAGKSYYVVNDENPEWVQIRLKNGAIGWISTKNIKR